MIERLFLKDVFSCVPDISNYMRKAEGITCIEIVLFLFMDSEEIQFFSIVIMRRYFIAK